MAQSQQYKNEYNKEFYKKLSIRIPKSKEPVLEDLSIKTGKSINRIFIEAVESKHHIDLTIDEARL